MTNRSRRFPETQKRLHRLLAILRILDNHGRCTPETLSARFGTAKRSIYRDINDLNEAGFSVTFDREDQTYRFTDPDYTLRDLDLNHAELAALLIARQLFQSLGTPFEKAYQGLMKKVHKDTGRKTQTRVRKVEFDEHFLIHADSMEGFEKIEKQYNAIKEAMDRKEEIQIFYKAMRSQKETRREFSPYGLIFNYGLWYTIGYCHLRKAIRILALDCIKDSRRTGKPYTIPPDFKLVDYFKPGWNMIQYGEPVEVVLKFSKESARWIQRRKWHPTQALEEQRDGSLLFRVTLRGTKELKWWTYHWVPYCEVLSPPELRREVAEEIRALGKVYQRSLP